jgi:hypothetical protein
LCGRTTSRLLSRIFSPKAAWFDGSMAMTFISKSNHDYNDGNNNNNNNNNNNGVRLK